MLVLMDFTTWEIDFLLTLIYLSFYLNFAIDYNSLILIIQISNCTYGFNVSTVWSYKALKLIFRYFCCSSTHKRKLHTMSALLMRKVPGSEQSSWVIGKRMLTHRNLCCSRLRQKYLQLQQRFVLDIKISARKKFVKGCSIIHKDLEDMAKDLALKE